MKTLIVLLTMLGCSANAQVLNNMNFAKKWNINGVPVASDATYSGVKLFLTGTGTLTTKVSLTKVKIFVMQYYTEVPSNFRRSEDTAYLSIKDVGHTAMKLTFMRGLDSKTIRDTINTYINNNITTQDMPLYQSDVDSVLSAISTDESFTTGSSITLAGYNNVITYENTKGVVTTIESRNNDIMVKLYSMFLGKTVDGDGRNFKLQLLQDPSFTFGDKQ